MSDSASSPATVFSSFFFSARRVAACVDCFSSRLSSSLCAVSASALAVRASARVVRVAFLALVVFSRRAASRSVLETRSARLVLRSRSALPWDCPADSAMIILSTKSLGFSLPTATATLPVPCCW